MSIFGVKLMPGCSRFTRLLTDFHATNYSVSLHIKARSSLSSGKLRRGFKKVGLADKMRFYNIAQGSLEECRYYLILARDLKYGDSDSLMRSLGEISRMLDGYTSAIRRHAEFDY